MALGAMIASSLVGYTITKGLDHVFKREPEKYKARLEKLINRSIDEYAAKYSIQARGGKFPFYQAQLFVDELLKYRFFRDSGYQLNENRIKEVLQSNSNILKPTTDELNQFFEIFEITLLADKDLIQLAIKEDSGEEIFNISQKVTYVIDQLDRIEINTEKIESDTEEIKVDSKRIIKILETKVKPEGKLPKELTDVPHRSQEKIVGRSEELKKIRELLLSKNETLLMNGMGGVGKTTIAQVYISSYYAEYKHIAWLNVEGDFKDAVISNYVLLMNLGLEKVEAEQQVSACLNALQNIKGTNLLVIDNASHKLAKYHSDLPKSPNWHVLVTSRERIEPFNIFDVEFLLLPDAVALFKKYCSEYEDIQVQSIVEKLERHTLTIEVLAKAAKRNKWSFEKCLGALSADFKVDVSVSHVGFDKKIDRIRTYLTEIFKASSLGEKEKWILKQFTALPSMDIEYKFLYSLLQIEQLEWSEEFASVLEGLYEVGFLQKNRESQNYKLHAVLNEVLRIELKVSVSDIETLLDTTTVLLSLDQSKDNPIDKFPFIPFGDSIIGLFRNADSSKIATLQSNLALVYQALGDYEKARDLLDAALKSDLANFGDKHPTVAVSQSNLATVYQDLGDYEKARDLFISARTIFQNSLGKDHLYTKTLEKFVNDIGQILSSK